MGLAAGTVGGGGHAGRVAFHLVRRGGDGGDHPHHARLELGRHVEQGGAAFGLGAVLLRFRLGLEAAHLQTVTLEVLQRAGQCADLVAAVLVVDRDRQVAGGDAVGGLGQLQDRRGDAPADPQGKPEADHRQHRDGDGDVQHGPRPRGGDGVEIDAGTDDPAPALGQLGIGGLLHRIAGSRLGKEEGGIAAAGFGRRDLVAHEQPSGLVGAVPHRLAFDLRVQVGQDVALAVEDQRIFRPVVAGRPRDVERQLLRIGDRQLAGGRALLEPFDDGGHHLHRDAGPGLPLLHHHGAERPCGQDPGADQRQDGDQGKQQQAPPDATKCGNHVSVVPWRLALRRVSRPRHGRSRRNGQTGAAPVGTAPARPATHFYRVIFHGSFMHRSIEVSDSPPSAAGRRPAARR